MKQVFKLSNIALLATILIFATSCEKEHDEDYKHDEGELITKVMLNLVNDSNVNDSQIAVWSDMDGIGGNDPIIPDTLRLKLNDSYHGYLRFYTTHDNHYEDITSEIIDEANDHLICYTPNTLAQVVTMQIERLDKDQNDLELGLETFWKGIMQDEGSIIVSLKHQPNIKTGDCALGETDVEIQVPYIFN